MTLSQHSGGTANSLLHAAAEDASTVHPSTQPHSSGTERQSSADSGVSPSSATAAASRPLTPAFAVQHAEPTSSDGSRRSDSAASAVSSSAATAATAAVPSYSSTASSGSLSPSSLSPPPPLSETTAARLAREEEMLRLLASKKRTLLAEIGALLTLRERLQAEMSSASASASGMPFDYAERFAHSPSTLTALQAAADAWREEVRQEQLQRSKEQRRADREHSVSMTSPRPRTASSASASAASTPSSNLHTPARNDRSSASAAEATSAPSSASSVTTNAVAKSQPLSSRAPTIVTTSSRPHTAPSPAAVSHTVSFSTPSSSYSHSPIQERVEEEEKDGKESDPSQKPHHELDRSPLPQPDLYNGIHFEESFYYDGEGEPEIDESFATAAPAATNRPHSAAAATQNYFSSPATNRAPPSSRPYTSGSRHSRPLQSHESVAPPHSFYSGGSLSGGGNSTGHNGDHATPRLVDDSGQPLGYQTQKALLKQRFEEESLASFQGQTLGGVAAEGKVRENSAWVNRPHYSNFNPALHNNAGAAGAGSAGGGNGSGSSRQYEAQHATNASHSSSHHGGRLKSPAAISSARRHSPSTAVSPARTRVLQNITNSNGAHTARSSAHSASKNTHITPHKDTTAAPIGDNYIRW